MLLIAVCFAALLTVLCADSLELNDQACGKAKITKMSLQKFKEFVFCMYKTHGLVDENGKIITENLQRFLNLKYDRNSRTSVSLMSQCKDINTDPPIELARELFECLNKVNATSIVEVDDTGVKPILSYNGDNENALESVLEKPFLFPVTASTNVM